MKHTVLSYVLPVLFALTATTTQAQSQGAKPALFTNFPDKINCNPEVLNQVFSFAAGQDATISGSSNFLFIGKLLSNTTRYDSLQTVVIRSAAFSDAIFVLSKLTGSDNKIEYRGRIINTKYADGYELKKDDAGNYQLVKFETDKLLQDCRQ